MAWLLWRGFYGVAVMAWLLWRNNIEYFIWWLEQRKKPGKVNDRTIEIYFSGKHRVFNPCGPRDQLNK